MKLIDAHFSFGEPYVNFCLVLDVFDFVLFELVGKFFAIFIHVLDWSLKGDFGMGRFFFWKMDVHLILCDVLDDNIDLFVVLMQVKLVLN